MLGVNGFLAFTSHAFFASHSAVARKLPFKRAHLWHACANSFPDATAQHSEPIHNRINFHISLAAVLKCKAQRNPLKHF